MPRIAAPWRTAGRQSDLHQSQHQISIEVRSPVGKFTEAAVTRDPAIDGLRAIAVTAVVAYHTGLSGVHGGFVGVDVFFVISGYIITRLLVREFSSTGSIDLTAFYARRVRRLLPAALVCMAVTMIASTFILQPALGEPQKFTKSVIYTLGLQVNLFFRQQAGGYFGGASNEQPLLHMWSLSVEEQYYLVWPFLLERSSPAMVKSSTRNSSMMDH